MHNPRSGDADEREENGEKRPFERLIHTPNYHRR
jgi:hypothetical protein